LGGPSFSGLDWGQQLISCAAVIRVDHRPDVDRPPLNVTATGVLAATRSEAGAATGMTSTVGHIDMNTASWEMLEAGIEIAVSAMLTP
jgi:hypothetical protein